MQLHFLNTEQIISIKSYGNFKYACELVYL